MEGHCYAESVANGSTLPTDVRTCVGSCSHRSIQFVPRRCLGPPATFRRLLYLYARADMWIKEIDKEPMCPVDDSQGESPTG